MDCLFFEKLKKKEAEQLLKYFLENESKNFEKFKIIFSEEGITVDFSMDSIIQVFEWMKMNVKVIPRNEDESLPDWIRQSDSYKKGLFSLDETSNKALLHISYYLGECFINKFDKLSWNIGRKGSSDFNMPVVTGFRHKMELAPILICENLLRRLIKGDDLETVKTALNQWESFIK